MSIRWQNLERSDRRSFKKGSNSKFVSWENLSGQQELHQLPKELPPSELHSIMRPQLARVLIFAVVVSCCVCWEPSPKTFELVPSYCAVADRDATDGFSAKYLHPVKKKASWSAEGLADLDMFYTRADPKR